MQNIPAAQAFDPTRGIGLQLLEVTLGLSSFGFEVLLDLPLRATTHLFEDSLGGVAAGDWL